MKAISLRFNFGESVLADTCAACINMRYFRIVFLFTTPVQKRSQFAKTIRDKSGTLCCIRLKPGFNLIGIKFCKA